ncbi:MAG: hypothetical protein JO262_03470 [Solirubrobacterales bacterium]|nr:hypothetical protein [Solirubrobacterales bacterium]
MTRCALGVPLARGGLALAGGLLPATPRLATQLLLLEPAEALSLAFPFLCALSTLMSRALPLVRGVSSVISVPLPLIGVPLALVGVPLALIGGPLAFIRDPVALIGGPLAFIRDPLALIGESIALVSGLLTHIDHPLATIARPLSFPRRPVTLSGSSGLGKALTLTPQRGALALQDIIIGRELSRPAVDLRDAVLDLNACTFFTVLARAGA